MDTIKMVEVTRSDFTESIHHGTAVLINSNGEILKEWGNSNILIYTPLHCNEHLTLHVDRLLFPK